MRPRSMGDVSSYVGGLSEQELGASFQAWLVGQPTLEAGDPDVVVGTWPRRR